MACLRKKIKINKDTLLYLTLLYIYLPIVIFLLTWLKLIIAVPVLIFSLIALYRLTMDVYHVNEQKKQEDIGIHIIFALLLLALIFVFGYYIGWSGGAPQAGDWNKHNAILRDLIEYEWPVYYSQGETAMLTYYIAQYLVPAFIGKICNTSFTVGQYALFIWNCLGIVLVVFWLLIVTRAKSLGKQIIAVLVFLFFGGMLPVTQSILMGWKGYSLSSQIDILHFLNIDEIYLQYRSNLTDMRWVFPQCIVPWLTILLFYHDPENRKHYMTMLLPTVLYGTLSFLGMAVLVLLYSAVMFVMSKERKQYLREIFSVWNIGMLLTLGSVFAAYLWGNVFSKKPQEIGLAIVKYSGNSMFIYFVFCLCMFGIYAILIGKKNVRNALFYVTIIVLMLIPFFKMGVLNDFCMCVSIVPLFIMMIMVIRYLLENASDGMEQMKKGMLIVCLCIGALYPAVELYAGIRDDDRSVKQALDLDGSLAQFADRSRWDITQDLKYNYYTYDLEESFFVQYMARK